MDGRPEVLANVQMLLDAGRDTTDLRVKLKVRTKGQTSMLLDAGRDTTDLRVKLKVTDEGR